jgi:lysyl-tRNA synthetase class 2
MVKPTFSIFTGELKFAFRFCKLPLPSRSLIISLLRKIMNIPSFNEIIEPNDQTEARAQHLNKLRELVGNVYPNKFERTKVSGEEDTITNLVSFAPISEVVEEIKEHVATLAERERPNPELKEKLNEKLRELGNVRISGRLAVPPRVMGKAAFVHLSDGIERLQIYVRRDDVQGVFNGRSEPSAVADGLTSDSQDSTEASDNNLQPPADSVNGWEMFQLLDHGDFIGVEGWLFLTNTGELSVHVEKLQFLAKAMLPMPDKIHGISDPELQRRYRYADLIASSLQIEHEGLTTREVFERRAKLISGMRRFLDDAGYIEVETPMLTPKATGAAATPFETHHKALDIPLYARIAPELYLKRLTVGGFEKVYELNRNFRNEGLSHKHNPEFTMLEFYCAYMDVNGMMDFAEAMLKESVQKATGGSLQVKYGENEIDFSKFERLTMLEAITSKTPKLIKEFNDSNTQGEAKHFAQWLKEKSNARFIHKTWKLFQENLPQSEEGEYFYNFKDKDFKLFEAKFLEIKEQHQGIELTESEIDKDILALFEDFVEENLIQPTFIIDYPKSISPLSKASPENPQIAERFELFINGMECANGFSELNDPQEQYERFVDQMKERETGDHEAMVMDEDYIRALAYGMPPAAGIGIGIDRLVMLLTNKHSIRDVILFPHMRPEKRETETEN